MNWIKNKLFGTIKEAVLSVLEHMLELVIKLFNLILDKIFDLLPALDPDYFIDLAPYVKVLNCWFPVDYAVLLLTAYLSARAIVLLIRVVIKLIPTVG